MQAGAVRVAEAGTGTGVGFGSTRVEALADGVFAIAMTLLILDIRVPEVPESDLAAAIVALWPRFLAYALSFVVLGVYWVGHHAYFRFIRRTDRVLLWLNILLFMSVVLVPFSTSLLGRYPSQRTAVAEYAANLAFTGSVNYLIWWYSTHGHRLVDTDIHPELVTLVKVRIGVAPVVCLVAIGVSFLSTPVSIALMILMIPFYILPGRVDSFFARFLDRHPAR